MYNTNKWGIPKQRLPLKVKLMNDKEWAKDCLKAMSSFNTAVSYTGDGSSYETEEYKRMLSNYKLYGNEIDQEELRKECKSLSPDLVEDIEFAPYNKIPNKVNALLGEELARKFDYKAIAVSGNGISVKRKEMDETVQTLLLKKADSLKAILIERYSSQKELTPEQQKELDAQIQEKYDDLISPTDLSKIKNTSFLSAKEQKINQMVKYFFYQQRLKEKMNDSMKHGIITGKQFTLIEEREYGVDITPLNSLSVFYHKSPDIKFIEDGLYAGYRTMMTIGDFLETEGNNLSEEDYEKLINRKGDKYGDDDKDDKLMTYEERDYISGDSIWASRSITKDEGQYGKPNLFEDIVVETIYWRSSKRIFLVNKIDENGEVEKFMLPEDFKIPKYAEKIKLSNGLGGTTILYTWDNFSLEETWVDEIWKGVVADGDIYGAVGPMKVQYRSIDNPNDIKLPIHGIIQNAMNSAPISFVDRARPFQNLYFVVMHKLKELIGRDKGKLWNFDASMVSEKMGLEKTLYYLESMDINIYNSLQNADAPGAHQRSTAFNSVDRSNMQHINNYIALLDAIDRQISDVSGINKGREGYTQTSETVTNAQQNLIQSSTITEAVYFSPHYSHWGRVLEYVSLVGAHYFKHTDNKVRQWVLDDMTLETLDLTDVDLTDADYGIFISNHIKDKQMFQTLKDLGLSLIQNDKATINDMVQILTANSAAELKDYLITVEEQSMEQQQAAAKEQQKAAEEMLQKELAEKEKDRQLERDIAALKAATAIKAKEIDVFKFQEDLDSNNNGVPDPLEIERLRHSKHIDEENIKLKKEELKIKKEALKSKNKASKSK